MCVRFDSSSNWFSVLSNNEFSGCKLTYFFLCAFAQVPAWKDIEVPAWKQIWVPELVKVGIPGEKFLGKDHEGWEYTRYISFKITLKSLGNNKTKTNFILISIQS